MQLQKRILYYDGFEVTIQRTILFLFILSYLKGEVPVLRSHKGIMIFLKYLDKILTFNIPSQVTQYFVHQTSITSSFLGYRPLLISFLSYINKGI
jgi:hypothetical protein